MTDQDFPSVSVAIITYNQREFLRECIDSILNQDYSNFEIVVADDASTDGTQDMLREYDRKHPGKFVLKLGEKNQGITANSNAAHFACKGKYICWMGGDDLMLPGKLSQQTAFMEKAPEYVICYHDLEVFESPSQRKLRLFSEKAKPRTGSLRELLRYGCFMGACSVMVRRSSAPKSGFDMRVSIASDWLYYVRTTQSGGRIGYLPSVLGKYRRHASNVTRQPSEQLMERSAQQDHFISAAIMLSEFPEYTQDIRSRIADLLYSSRGFSEKNKAKGYVCAALNIKPSLLNFARFLLFVFRIRQ
ncbi:glycosyltransferase [Marinobacter salarius]|uniref:glycosyltransferase family 2 protein n=1 Tax=Marinobacter salarius TaxID=1420917 RepID=UPI0018F25847|nr:glycosyltransferase [Marinobacter salarius]MBJ7278471.1 glycosyltransferase [Marinobacter salarius]